MPSERKLQTVFGSHARSLVWFIVIVVAFTGVVFFFYRVKRQLVPAEYEGKVVDKWVGYSQTETGSDPYFRLLVEADGGQRSTVAVDQETFERAKVGMRIKKTQSGIELSALTEKRKHFLTSGGNAALELDARILRTKGRA